MRKFILFEIPLKTNCLLKVFPAIIFIFLSINVSGQKTVRKADNNNGSHWMTGLSYMSDNVYQGRKDSAAVPYITPSIGYYHKSGFFVNGSLSYLPVSGESRIDLVTIEAGYSHYTEHFNMELSAAKDFYSDESFSVSSEISGRLSAYFSYDFNFIEPYVDLGANIGSSNDIGIGLGLQHSISFLEDHFVISPALLMNSGTQNFYANYYNKRKFGPNRNNKNPNIISVTLNDASRFQVMDYELTAPFEYTLQKKLKLNFTPTYAIPVNPSDITVEANGNSKKTVPENLSNVFYFSVGFTYSF
ncbi:MAG: hypothetical protein C5B52_10800 [Bacteroidetes bacterium]|nr:MAG: hypothetical protein C5B52_10800 [Bacteroidota bacterium]